MIKTNYYCIAPVFEGCIFHKFFEYVLICEFISHETLICLIRSKWLSHILKLVKIISVKSIFMPIREIYRPWKKRYHMISKYMYGITTYLQPNLLFLATWVAVLLSPHCYTLKVRHTGINHLILCTVKLF